MSRAVSVQDVQNGRCRARPATRNAEDHARRGGRSAGKRLTEFHEPLCTSAAASFAALPEVQKETSANGRTFVGLQVWHNGHNLSALNLCHTNHTPSHTFTHLARVVVGRGPIV